MLIQSLTVRSTRHRAPRVLLVGMIVAALVFAVIPSIASASNAYSGSNLPGHTWTAGNGVFLYPENYIYAWANTTSSVCVGPVTVSGGKAQIPYGWACNPGSEGWEFSPIDAAAGIDNPNPGTFNFYEVYAS
jgi:hypothetical protein